jgi:hypothetical protein
MLCLVRRPLLDNFWQYVPGGGVIAMFVGIFSIVCGAIVVAIALYRSYPAASVEALIWMVV